jgi:hypothetical protein
MGYLHPQSWGFKLCTPIIAPFYAKVNPGKTGSPKQILLQS